MIITLVNDSGFIAFWCNKQCSSRALLLENHVVEPLWHGWEGGNTPNCLFAKIETHGRVVSTTVEAIVPAQCHGPVIYNTWQWLGEATCIQKTAFLVHHQFFKYWAIWHVVSEYLNTVLVAFSFQFSGSRSWLQGQGCCCYQGCSVMQGCVKLSQILWSSAELSDVVQHCVKQ